MRDLERELRALSRPEPSPELDERIERLHANAPRGMSERGSAARRRTLTVVRAAALLLVGWLLGRATAPPHVLPETADQENAAEAAKNDTLYEAGESPHPTRAAGEPPLIAAANVRELVAPSPAAPPLFVPPPNARSVLKLLPVPSED